MQDNSNKKILSLFDYSGIWSEPYRRAGYDVVQVDIKHGDDVRLVKHPGKVHGIIMQPPCTHFAVSGARWWKQKGDEAIINGLELVNAGLRFVATCRPEWWVLENPVGRLKHYIGDWSHAYQPHEYAGYLDDPDEQDEERYTKKTCLWGDFNMPAPKDLGDLHGSKMHRLPPTPDRAEKRSLTPRGFAEAFFLANP